MFCCIAATIFIGSIWWSLQAVQSMQWSRELLKTSADFLKSFEGFAKRTNLSIGNLQKQVKGNSEHFSLNRTLWWCMVQVVYDPPDDHINSLSKKYLWQPNILLVPCWFLKRCPARLHYTFLLPACTTCVFCAWFPFTRPSPIISCNKWPVILLTSLASTRTSLQSRTNESSEYDRKPIAQIWYSFSLNWLEVNNKKEAIKLYHYWEPRFVTMKYFKMTQKHVQ